MDEVMTVADAGGSRALNGSPSSQNLLPHNLPLLSAFLAFALAQFLKVFTNWSAHPPRFLRSAKFGFCFTTIQDVNFCTVRYKEKRWDSKKMISSGGMPSSHSATVTALALAIALAEGAGSPAFAIALVLACVVMYDASGVRLHAGRQAELLNQIVCEFPSEHPLSTVKPLRELLGHTPIQVAAGAVLGCVVAYLTRSTS
ncbi:hypothetical protein IGI04_019816 [Brassica rapa subsp. trilocularis]|uniref:Phosphatidic acid phosphatase type 2/haloperoxidase domain-containing protein n=1 Tax=Brassica rapa subsp. trilocularis TaxID=1813537 RepID=A0ABQ7MGX2_BRACM|nr:hypothetical protein IGI04_019816 [Brassica rapa subsp. trilocularis]